MDINARCAEHSQPCRKCSSAHVLSNQKPSMGKIPKSISDNIYLEPIIPNQLYEIRYNVLMRHDNILDKMYPLAEAQYRYSSACCQVKKIILGKVSKGHLEAIKKIDSVLNRERVDGKIELLTKKKFDVISSQKPMAFTPLNILFNPDSLSTPERLIQDFTSKIGSTTLSLGVLTLDKTLGNMGEAALSFRLFKYIRTFDIAKCFTQIHLTGPFLWCSLNIWFDDLPHCKEPVIYKRPAMAFGFPNASTVLELSIFKFIYEQITDQEIRVIIDLGRFSDNVNVNATNISQLDTRSQVLIEAFRKYSLLFKPPSEPHSQFDINDVSLKKRFELVEETLYGYLWNLSKDTIQPSMDLFVFSKTRGTKTYPNLAEMHPDITKVSGKSLSILAATIVSIYGCLMAPIQLGTKALLSRASQVCQSDKSLW